MSETMSNINVVTKLPEFSDIAYRDIEGKYWATWNKQNPKPIVQYWEDDVEFQRNRETQTEDPVTGKDKEYICPRHGVPNNLTRKPKITGNVPGEQRVYVSRLYGCSVCLLQEMYSMTSQPDYSADYVNEKNPHGFSPYIFRIMKISKQGKKGNEIPKDWKAYEALQIWRQKHDKAAIEWTEFLKTHTAQFQASAEHVSMILDKIREGEIELTKKGVKSLTPIHIDHEYEDKSISQR